MIAAPLECRILTALTLAPMCVFELARALSSDHRSVRARIDYLRSTLEVVPANPGANVTKFTLTPKGLDWAQVLMA